MAHAPAQLLVLVVANFLALCFASVHVFLNLDAGLRLLHGLPRYGAPLRGRGL
jgi:hypothetical protein